MTMKAILLGAAAGLVTVGAAQAADLPMTKAEAVEYVKVCTEFGEGFFYIPGSDTCLKIAGEVRANYRFDSRDDRADDVTEFGSEARLKFDARTSTEYGTLRSYLQVNVPFAAGASSVALDKAFIQLGGLTAGKAHSFFGIYDAHYANTIFSGYYGFGGDANLLAYTATFGGGFAATLSIEDGRDHRGGLLAVSDGVVGVPGPPVVLPVAPFSSAGTYGGQSLPDIVGALNVVQGWGEAGVSGAIHQVRYPVAPDADYGFAASAAVAVNLPIGIGGHFVVEGTYADGAGNYLGGSHDGIYRNAAAFEADSGRGWSVTGEFGVGISPVLTTTAFASYIDYTGASVAVANASFPLVTSFEDPDFTSWIVGVNAVYTVVPGLTVGAEVAYKNVDADGSASADSWQGGVQIKRVF